MTNQSDNQIIEQERRGHRRAMTVFPAAALVLFVVAAVVDWALKDGWLPQWMNHPSFLGFVVGLGGTVLLIVFMRLVAATPREAKSERILRKQIDDHNRRAQYLYLLLAAAIAMDAWALPTFGMTAPGRDIADWVTPAGFAFGVVCLGLLVSFGPCFARRAFRRALNDEWTRAMRGWAAIIGYTLSVAALAIVYLVNLYRPNWNSTLLPALMAIVVVIPAIAFLTRQWRAGESHD